VEFVGVSVGREEVGFPIFVPIDERDIEGRPRARHQIRPRSESPRAVSQQNGDGPAEVQDHQVVVRVGVQLPNEEARGSGGGRCANRIPGEKRKGSIAVAAEDDDLLGLLRDHRQVELPVVVEVGERRVGEVGGRRER
jgi:hypothetical protein